MKITFALSLILFMFTACNQDTEGQQTEVLTEETENLSTSVINNPATATEMPADTVNLPKISFNEMEHDFGQIDEGDKAEHAFTFTNTGKTDLIISDVQGSCGCTVPYFPRKPIKPGETEEIKVTYNSKGKQGLQRKSITVIANTWPNNTNLYIQADVKK